MSEPVTATLSLEAFQLRFTWLLPVAVAAMFAGTVGGVVSPPALFTVIVRPLDVVAFDELSTARAVIATGPSGKVVESQTMLYGPPSISEVPTTGSFTRKSAWA